MRHRNMDGPLDLVRLLRCGDVMGLQFALELILFLKTYSLFLSGACVCVFPMHLDILTPQKELCLLDSNVSFKSNSWE